MPIETTIILAIIALIGELEARDRPAGLVLDVDLRLPHGGDVDVEIHPRSPEQRSGGVVPPV